MQKRLEEFFHYKWSNDKNGAISSEEEMKILHELPIQVQDRLYCSFLFNDFFKKYKTMFLLTQEFHKEKEKEVIFKHSPNCHSKNYTWSDPMYRDFMS